MRQVLEEQSRIRPSNCSSHNSGQAPERYCPRCLGRKSQSCWQTGGSSRSRCPGHWKRWVWVPPHTHTLPHDRRLMWDPPVVGTMGKPEDPCQAWPASQRSPQSLQTSSTRSPLQFPSPSPAGSRLTWFPCSGVSPSHAINLGRSRSMVCVFLKAKRTKECPLDKQFHTQRFNPASIYHTCIRKDGYIRMLIGEQSL